MADMKLRECPFCGNEAHIEEIKGTPFQQAVIGTTFSAGCSDENCIGYQSLTHFATRAKSVEAWNTRTESPEITTLQAQLAEARFIDMSHIKQAVDAYAEHAIATDFDTEPSISFECMEVAIRAVLNAKFLQPNQPSKD